MCTSAVVTLDTPCSEVVWKERTTHSIRQFPRHFPYRASPCAITFKLESTTDCWPCLKASQHLYVCTQHASSWPLSCELVRLSCSLIRNWNIYLLFICDILKNCGRKVCFCQFIQWRSLTPLYKYYINWYLPEILHNVDFATQIFLHFWTNMIVDICALQRCYAACSCNFSPKFRDNLWVQSWPLKMEPIGCPEKSARDCHYTLRNIPEERRSHVLRGGSMKSTLSTVCFKKEHTLRKWMYFCKFQVLTFTILCYICCSTHFWRLDPKI